MTECDFEKWRDRRLSDYVSSETMKRAGASLAELNRQPLGEPSDFRSYVIDTWERAWTKPLNQLTLEEVRILLGQKDGMPWLAMPVAEFIAQHPDAEVEHYPGDLTMAALRMFDELKAADKEAARQISGADFGWIEERYTFDRSLRREAQELVATIQA